MARTNTAVHFFRDDFTEIIREIGSLFIHTEDTVDFGFDAFSKLEVIGRIIPETLLVLFSKCVLSVSRIDFRS